MIRSKVYLKFILSNIIVLVIPMIIISFITYKHYVNNFTQEVTNTTSTMLMQISDIMDIRLTDLRNIAYQVSNNPSITPVLSEKDKNRIDPYPDLYKSIKELYDYKFTNGIIENIFLFFRDDEIVLSDNSKYGYEAFYNNVCRLENIKKDQFYKIVESVDELTVLPSQPAYMEGKTMNIITYMQPIPIDNSYSSTTLAITVKDSMMQQMIQKVLEGYNGYVFIVDSKDNIITRAGSYNGNSDGTYELDLARNFINYAKAQNKNNSSIENNNYIMSYIKSEASGWKYVAVMPSGQIHEKVAYIKKLYMGITFFALIIGLIFALYFSSGNYSNVKKITDIIMANRKGADSSKIYKNEWYIINNAIKDYITENKSLQQSLNDQLPLIRNEFFLKLLNGDIKDSTGIKPLAEFVNVNLEYPCYAIIIAAVDDNDLFHDQNPEPSQEVILLTVLGAAEEQFNRMGRGYTVRLSREKIAIVVCINEEDSTKDLLLLKDSANNICNFVKEKFNFTVTLSVSNIYDKLTCLKNAYSEAETALNYRIIKGNNTVICYGEIGNRMNKGYFYTFDQEKLIIQFLRQGEFESIKSILCDVVLQLKNTSVSIEVIRCVYFWIINTAFKSQTELGITGLEYEEYLFNMLGKGSIDELYNDVCKFYKKICEQVNRAKFSKNIDLKAKVIDFINENYSNSSLSVEMVADEFSLSASYVGRFFKSQIGRNFVDYINEFRMEKAKEMLSATDKKIGEIAEAVGYNSVYNFTRVFKRYESITPSQFKLSSNIVVKNVQSDENINNPQ